MSPVALPDFTLERELLRDFPLIIACDEVGRGALAGPVCVGTTMVDATSGACPEGLRDSKLVSELKRPALAERAATWAHHSSVGWASAAEVDSEGIIRALGLAAVRAIADLASQGVDVGAALVILDGSHDYISREWAGPIAVRPVVKADRDCASAAAASVIAKVARDTLMVELHQESPVYAWERNKGYGSAVHRDAIREHGASAHHRHTWLASEAYQTTPLFV